MGLQWLIHKRGPFHHASQRQLVFDLQKEIEGNESYQFSIKKYNERLVPVEENTSISKISGFVLKPNFPKGTREQFIFINNRFIKSNSLNTPLILFSKI